GAHVSIGALDGDTADVIIKQQARRIDELERVNAELRGHGAHVSIGALDGDTADVIIKQQARRIDELERVNAELRGQIAATT
ncbi:hypothetical protein KHP57_23525, partial [Algiphilus sp. NNCM1]|nr:hypothetical protein [Algiphilus acroporae]